MGFLQECVNWKVGRFKNWQMHLHRPLLRERDQCRSLCVTISHTDTFPQFIG